MKKRRPDPVPKAVKTILEALGEDPGREGLRKTPERVAASLRELTSGYREDVDALFNGALFDVEYSEMVMVKDINFYSLCVPSKQLINAVGGAKPARSVRVGDRLWCLDKGRLRTTTVREVSSHQTREIVEVATPGSRFKVTPDHPVMTKDGWKEAASLRPGDLVEWVNSRSLCRRRHSARPGYSLGYALGAIGADGSVQERRRVSLVVKSESFASKFAGCLSEAFSLPRPLVEKIRVPSGFSAREIPMCRVRVVSRDIGEKVSRWFGLSGARGENKTKSFRFPAVATCTQETMQGFLDGYCDGDGRSVNSGGRFITRSNRRFLDELGRYLQTPTAKGGDGIFRVYVSNRWSGPGWYGRHGFRREREFYIPLDSEWLPVESARRLPAGKKPHTVYSIKCRPHPCFLIAGHLTHNCEHHVIPFFGKATVAYIPRKHVVGLSKIPRLVQVFASRLQVQERMTQQIADTLQERLKPLGVGVILSARHLCMEMRGVQCQLSPTVTSAMLGAFRKDPRTRDEFLKLAQTQT